MKMFNHWNGPGGYRHVLNVSLPLVMSMGSLTLMMFTDRLFLSRYSIDTISAAMPAGIASFLFISFFMGIAGYINVFVAQYTGAGRKEKVGASLRQGSSSGGDTSRGNGKGDACYRTPSTRIQVLISPVKPGT